MQEKEKIHGKEKIIEKSVKNLVEIKKISDKNSTLKLLVNDADTVLVNCFRRAVMADVQTFAAKNILIYENSSIMPDEMLAHRISMIPIKADAKKYKEDEIVKLVLEKEGPCTVYSRDIKSTDPKIDVPDKKVMIVKLKKDQKLKIEIEAGIGKGSDHAKWQPAIIGYRNIAEISVGKECNLCKDCISACSKKLLEVKGKSIALAEPAECDLCGECKDACKAAQLKIRGKENSFLLSIETLKGLEHDEIIDAAIDNLEKKTEEFRKALKEL